MIGIARSSAIPAAMPTHSSAKPATMPASTHRARSEVDRAHAAVVGCDMSDASLGRLRPCTDDPLPGCLSGCSSSTAPPIYERPLTR
ncbi:hypothetical protein HMPREF0762_00839 [Slackia exigua ATCC 700122]|uniref:Uncharacterized protein n=1 Tax=Slackia exigua (strain ATCC 700122 / DSM 15923 / CIP 105133 / JCM 11022 / KCTC 5966 / S-7) TaxID=649764 RepID=D0WG88_SLAES|nr:hypothetical protein HMPREF0762_00839 [Slackia exigua ATCC 700122]